MATVLLLLPTCAVEDAFAALSGVCSAFAIKERLAGLYSKERLAGLSDVERKRLLGAFEGTPTEPE